MSRVYSSLREIFHECQESVACHQRLMRDIYKIFYKVGLERFWPHLKCILMQGMGQSERTPQIELFHQFAAQSILFICSRDHETNKTPSSEVDEHPLLNRVFQFLVDSREANSKFVRLRVAQLIHQLLDGMGDGAAICDDLYKTIQDCLLSRIWDVWPTIRAEAVRALARLQDPTDRDCPVVTAYMHLAKHDPVPEVRRAAVQTLAITTRTLFIVVERALDVSDLVRKAALEILAERVSMRPLRISHRVRLLQEGLNDRAEIVRSVCEHKLLVKWFESVDNCPIRFLSSLDVEANSKVCEVILSLLFKRRGVLEQAQEFANAHLDDKHCLKEEAISLEKAFYWKVLVKYLRAYDDSSDCHLGEALELILPSPAVLANLLGTQAGLLAQEVDLEARFSQTALVQHLLEFTSLVDWSDEFGRRALRQRLRAILMDLKLPGDIVPLALAALKRIEPGFRTEASVQREKAELRVIEYVAEMVNELRLPECEVLAPATSKTHLAPSDIPPPAAQLFEKVADTFVIDEKLVRRLQMDEARLRLQRNEMREEQDEAVQAQNFERAAELRNLLCVVDTQINDAREKLDLARNPSITAKKEEISNDKEEVDEACQEEARTQDVVFNDVEQVTERSDPTTMERVAELVCQVMKTSSLTRLKPIVRALVDSVALVCVRRNEPVIRNLGLQALGVACIWERDMAVQYLPLFLAASRIDVEAIQVSALRCLFDCFLVHGLEPFVDLVSDNDISSETCLTYITGNKDSIHNEDDVTVLKTQNAPNVNCNVTLSSEEIKHRAASSLLNHMITLLHSSSSEMRTVCAEGLAKLLLLSRVISSKLISRLLLQWYSPTTSEDHYLRQCLAKFFTAYAFNSEEYQERMSEAVLPTLRTLLRAPASSPLSEVDPWNVATLLLELTDARSRWINQRLNSAERDALDNKCHDELALRLLNEVLDGPNGGAGTRLFMRMLAQLRLSNEDNVVLREICVMLNAVKKRVKDKIALQAVNRVLEQLSRLNIPSTFCDAVENSEQTDKSIAVASYAGRSILRRSLCENEDDKEHPTFLGEGNASLLEQSYLGRKLNRTQRLLTTSTINGNQSDNLLKLPRVPEAADAASSAIHDKSVVTNNSKPKRGTNLVVKSTLNEVSDDGLICSSQTQSNAGSKKQIATTKVTEPGSKTSQSNRRGSRRLSKDEANCQQVSGQRSLRRQMSNIQNSPTSDTPPSQNTTQNGQRRNNGLKRLSKAACLNTSINQDSGRRSSLRVQVSDAMASSSKEPQEDTQIGKLRHNQRNEFRTPDSTYVQQISSTRRSTDIATALGDDSGKRNRRTAALTSDSDNGDAISRSTRVTRKRVI